MKWGWVGAALFLMFSLVACVERQEVALESTAVPTPLPTIEPTVTETAVPAIATVVEETAVPTLAPPTETPTPPSPLANVLDFQQLAEVPLDASAAYNLRTPDYDLLHDWLRVARVTPERGLPYYHIFNLLAFDFARSFPHGAGQLEPVFQESEYPGGYLAERLTWPLLETAVVAHLNQNQISLEDGNPIDIPELTVIPQATDLNSDGVSEWLLAVESKDLATRQFQK